MKIFIDTDTLVGLTLSVDNLHQQACKISKNLSRVKHELFTSSDVLKEALTVISQRGGKKVALDFLKTMESKKSGIDIIFVNEELHHEGIKMFTRIKQKDISVVDCVSYIIMKQYSIEYIFSFDKHFSYLGCKLLNMIKELRSSSN